MDCPLSIENDPRSIGGDPLRTEDDPRSTEDDPLQVSGLRKEIAMVELAGKLRCRVEDEPPHLTGDPPVSRTQKRNRHGRIIGEASDPL